MTYKFTAEAITKLFLSYFIGASCCLFIIFPLTKVADARQKPRTPSHNESSILDDSTDSDQFITEIKKYLGIKYKRGGTTERGIDCSGFTKLVYKKFFGVDIPHNASYQFHTDSENLTDVYEDEFKPGDILFFSSTSKKKKISHVGIYLSSGNFIHSAAKKGIIISNLSGDYWQKHFVSAKRASVQNNFERDDNSFENEDIDNNNSLNIFAERNIYSSYDIDRYSSALENALSYNIALDYSQPLINSSWDVHLTPFNQTILLGKSNLSLLPPALRTEMRNTYMKSYKKIYNNQGIKLSSGIRPADWLSITPSYTYYNYDRKLQDLNLPTQSLGFDLSLGSLAENGWSFSTAVQYSTINNSSTHLRDMNNDIDTVDVSLTYNYNLSDRLQLSVMGQHFSQSLKNIADESDSDSIPTQRLFFMLNFKY